MSQLILERTREPLDEKKKESVAIRSIEVVEGPNIWAKFPVSLARVDLSSLQELTLASRKETEKLLKESMPRHAQDRRSGQVLNFSAILGSTELERCECNASWGVELLLSTVMTLHAVSRRSLKWSRVVQESEEHVFLIVMECEEEGLSHACFELAAKLCTAAINKERVDLIAELQNLETLSDDVCLGATTGAIVEAARNRGIPVQRLDSESLVQLGHGAQQRRIHASYTDQTGIIAETVSIDKHLTKSLLRQVGVPVPEGRPVHNREDAWRAACELGLPVVVKPRNGDYGLGVSLNLSSRDLILNAYDEARTHREQVMVERFAIGEQHRITVVGQKVVAAVRRVSPTVCGDGIRTVSALLDQANENEDRGPEDFKPIKKVALDVDTLDLLTEQRLSLDAVPEIGQIVKLSRLAHTWSGGTVEDVTDRLHPEVVETCIRAARVIGLDLAGIDLIALDIGKPLASQGGVVLEVNAGPAIFLHLAPFCERPRPVCEAILEHLFQRGTGRIPTVLVCNSPEKPNAGELIERFLIDCGLRIGRSSSEGIYVNGVCLRKGPLANRAGARAVLLCPDVELAILEQTRDSILNEGLAVDRCSVAIFQQPTSPQDQEYDDISSLLRDAVGQRGLLVSSLGDITLQRISDGLFTPRTFGMVND